MIPKVRNGMRLMGRMLLNFRLRLQELSSNRMSKTGLGSGRPDGGTAEKSPACPHYQ